MEFPVATSPAPGVMGVDWEIRVDFERLRQHRLSRVRTMMEQFDLGALLLFETSNIRYATATQIGYWAFNKGERWALITREGPPRYGVLGWPPRPHATSLPACKTRGNLVAAKPGFQTPGGPGPGFTARAFAGA